jgi:hypothetical protein
MSGWEILAGLPPYGPEAIAFSSTGQCKHREGFVVRFRPENAEEWVGNFQPGLYGLADVLGHPNGKYVIVIAGGQGYIVSPVDRKCLETFGSQIEYVKSAPRQHLVLFVSLTGVAAIGIDGLTWRSRRISWDGFRNLSVTETQLVGEAYSPLDDVWHDFEVDLSNGNVTGGSFIEVR